MNNILKITIVFLLFAFASTALIGQARATFKTLPKSDREKAYIDSLEKVPYKWRFPILGAKIRKMGFDLPLPNGIMVNYIVGSQYITIDNLAVGLKNDPSSFINVDKIARFEEIKPFVNVFNIRYDVWIFPFLDIYALGGYVHSVTDVKLALPIKAEFTSIGNGPMVGWGFVLAGGFGPLFAEMDFNMAWTFMPQLFEPSLAKVFDIRVGHLFKFPKRPWSNFSIIVGAEWLKINPSSYGSADLSALSGGGGGGNSEKKEDLEDWYNELPEYKQDAVSDLYEAFQSSLSGEGDEFIYYTFDKKLYYPWSMTVGVNYQINARFILDAFYTFLGSRNQLVVGVNYRFGFKGKNFMEGVTL